MAKGRLNQMWLLTGFAAAMTGCAAHYAYYVPECDERLAAPDKRKECRACVERPIPHGFLPGGPDGARCVRR
jgi:hypothetical protein